MKETFEWIHSWCDYTTKNNLPRVLLIGDSITNGYQEFVRKKLKGIAYVDHLVISYPVNRPIYHALLKQFESDSKYDLIHYNNGLHDINISKKVYKDNIKKLLKEFKCKNIILANTTIVNNNHNKGVHKKWLKVVNARNEAINEISKECHLLVDDLFTLSKKIDVKDRYVDGLHYVASGYQILAAQVASAIKKHLKE